MQDLVSLGMTLFTAATDTLHVDVPLLDTLPPLLFVLCPQRKVRGGCGVGEPPVWLVVLCVVVGVWGYHVVVVRGAWEPRVLWPTEEGEAAYVLGLALVFARKVMSCRFYGVVTMRHVDVLNSLLFGCAR